MDTTQFEFELSLKTDFHRDQRAHVAILKLMWPHSQPTCKVPLQKGWILRNST